MIQAILFDLDGTLLNRNASVLAFLADQYTRLIAPNANVPFDIFRERFVALDANGYDPFARKPIPFRCGMNGVCEAQRPILKIA